MDSPCQANFLALSIRAVYTPFMTGAELRERRKALNLSQVEMAEALGISGNTVARWERDEIGIPPYLDLALSTIERQSKPKKK